MCGDFFKLLGLLKITELDFIIVKIRHFYIVKTVILVSKRFFSIVYGGGIDLKSETDIAKDEVKWGKN